MNSANTRLLSNVLCCYRTEFAYRTISIDWKLERKSKEGGRRDRVPCNVQRCEIANPHANALERLIIELQKLDVDYDYSPAVYTPYERR